MRFKYIFLFFIFLGCHPVQVSGLLYSSTPSPYMTQNTSYQTSYTNKSEEFITTRLLDTLFEKMVCGHFEVELIDYFRLVLFHISTPSPDLFNTKIQRYTEKYFENKIASHKKKLISTMLSQMYQTSFDFVSNKSSDMALEDWNLVERINSSYSGGVSGSSFQRGREYLDQIGATYTRLSELMKAQYLCDNVKVFNRGHSFTVGEGVNIFQIADILSSKQIISKEEFLKVSKDPQLIRELLGDEGLLSLEGYLYPGKYTVNPGDTAITLVKRMVYRFLDNYNYLQSHHQYTLLPFSRHDIVTLASIIDEEAVLKVEKPMIASVFFNRLSIGMKLQSDPTVRYGVWWYEGYRPSKLSKKHFDRHTHYNTYQVEGLPRGPISNPGYSALNAVFNPDTTPYYFFVSQGDGRTHTFSRTYEEHLEAVEDYRQVKRQQAMSIQ